MAKNPAYILHIDSGGEIGTAKFCSSTVNYALADLPYKLVLAVVNFPRKQIGPIMSEVLVLGVPDQMVMLSLLGQKKFH